VLTDNIASGFEIEEEGNKEKEIPLEKGQGLLGVTIPLIKDPFNFAREKREEFGNVFRGQAGPKEVIFISGNEVSMALPAFLLLLLFSFFF
jgi:hypothetical protein